MKNNFLLFSPIKFKVFQKVKIYGNSTSFRYWMNETKICLEYIRVFLETTGVFFFPPFFPHHIFKSRKMKIFKFL